MDDRRRPVPNLTCHVRPSRLPCMNTRIVFAACGVLLVAACARAQTIATATNDPFPKPINTTDDVVTVNFVEFASLPDVGGQAARMMLLVDEPGSRRIFVNDMFGIV